MTLKIHLVEKHGKIMLVAKITEATKVQIENTEYQSGSNFNPIEDNAGECIVSLVEAQYLPITDFEVIEFEPMEIQESEIL